ncbi:MAG: EthD family reductase [Burkholderiales bacterium]|nr:EthD family reductase [Burkholderiales bacterium]
MAKLVVIYNQPADPAAFDAYYFNKHVPLAKTIPGLRAYEVNAGPVATPAGPAPYHLIATLTFDDMAAIGAAFASKEGQAAAADVGNFAQAGVQMLMFETRQV